MLRFALFIALFTFSQLSFGQVRAITESGNKVVLFDNGTWEYDEKKVTKTTQKDATPVPAAHRSLAVDTQKNTEPNFTEVFITKSARLVRYFGETKGMIRCKLACSNNLGNIRVHYKWDIPVGDAQRYFGYLKTGTRITLHMLDGQKLELLVGEDSNVKALPKYNVSAIWGVTQALNQEQLLTLTAQPVLKIEVDWKKRPENYEVQNTKYFMETLPTVF